MQLKNNNIYIYYYKQFFYQLNDYYEKIYPFTNIAYDMCCDRRL